MAEAVSGDPTSNQALPVNVEEKLEEGIIQIPSEKDLPDAENDRSETSRRASSSIVEDESSPSKIIVTFEPGDPTNPYNFSTLKKLYIVVVCILLVFNNTITSSLPSGASAEIRSYFHITEDAYIVLPVSIYLVGYVLGPLAFAPMSETFGRKPVLTSTFLLFTAFQLGTALAPNYAGFVVARLLAGMGASTPISVVGGVYADIYATPEGRGRAVTVFMAATMWGPLIGPVMSGFISVVSWRWTFWAGLIIAGVTWPFFILMPETFGPTVLKHKAQKLRKKTGNLEIVAPIELVKTDWSEFVVVTLTRPLRMFFFEWIVLSSCLYMSLAYAIFYIYLQAYPIIFQGIYGFNAGEEGLTFLPIGIGAAIAVLIYVWWEQYLKKAKAQNRSWSHNPDFVRLPIACFGAPLFAISSFWLGWTAFRSIHWIVPTLSAIPFGMGYLLIFMSLVNYQVDSYEIYAASAMAAGSCSRSIFGVVLPFAAKPMFDALGVHWACSLLGFLSVAMGIVPFVFIKYGAQIRANSKWCQELQRLKEERAREADEKASRGSIPIIAIEPEKQV